MKAEAKEGEFLFPGGKKNTPLSNMACLALLKRMGRGDLTVHGFRSTFEIGLARLLRTRARS